jgi:hypothetical protein
MFGFGCPLQKGYASVSKAIRVHVRGFRQLLFEQASKLPYAFVASEDASTLQDDDIWRHVALDILFEAMFTGEPQMVLENLRG